VSYWRGATRRVLAAAAVAATCIVALGTSAAASERVTLTGVAQHQLATGGTRTFTITGSGFRPGAVVGVSGGGVAASHTSVVSPTRLATVLTASTGATLGERSLRVTVGGHSGVLVHALRVTSPPTLTGVRPGHVAASGLEVRLTLTGTHFERGLLVAVGATRLPHVDVHSSTTATVGAAFPSTSVLGWLPVTVTNPDGGVASNLSALKVDAAPAIYSSGTRELDQGETTTETIVGTGFQSGATLIVGPSVTVVVTSVTPTQLVATLHASTKATVGPRTLTVRNPDNGTATQVRGLRIGYVPIFRKWAVGDGAVKWSTTMRRPMFLTLPTLAFSGAGVTVASEALNASGQLVVQFTIAPSAPATWRTMTITQGSSTWVVHHALKVRLAPTISSFPSLKQGTIYRTVVVKGANFEVCATRDPVVTVSGPGVTVDRASTAFSFLMYVTVSVAPTATVGPRDVTMTNCDSGGTATSVGVFTVIAG
jgi:hypothetical protein